MTTDAADPSRPRQDGQDPGLSGAALTIVTHGPSETYAIGELLAGWLRIGDVVLLHGDLGAGKTTLAKGIAAGLGVDAVVSSPSFALVNEYETRLPAAGTHLIHLDLYRLQGEDELSSIGFDEFLVPVDAVTLVEWPERAATALPERYLLVEIESVGPAKRRIRFAPVPEDEVWAGRMEQLRSELAPPRTTEPT